MRTPDSLGRRCARPGQRRTRPHDGAMTANKRGGVALRERSQPGYRRREEGRSWVLRLRPVLQRSCAKEAAAPQGRARRGTAYRPGRCGRGPAGQDGGDANMSSGHRSRRPLIARLHAPRLQHDGPHRNGGVRPGEDERRGVQLFVGSRPGSPPGGGGGGGGRGAWVGKKTR